MPKVKAAFLVHCANPNGVLLLAIPATPEKPLVSLARLGVCHLVDFDASAVDTGRSVAPTQSLQQFYGGQLIRASHRHYADQFGLGKLRPFIVVHVLIIYLAQSLC